VRNEKSASVVSIVGYTNAGKSTLLNALRTATCALSANVCDARSYISAAAAAREQEIIINDTVGFIPTCRQACSPPFALAGRNWRQQVAHSSGRHFDPRWSQQIQSVERILEEFTGADSCNPGFE